MVLIKLIQPSLRRWIAASVLSIFVISIFAFALGVNSLLPDELSWRSRVILAKLEGKLPEIPTRELLKWLSPGSQLHLKTLAYEPNVQTGIKNPYQGHTTEKIGSLIYGRYCSHCHGANANGQSEPDLVKFVQSHSDWDFLALVKWGRPSTVMQAQPLSILETWQVHAYLTALSRENSENDQSADSWMISPINLSPESILKASKMPHQWLTYAGNYAGHRYSTLSQINKRTVKNLRLAWATQPADEHSSIISTPLVIGPMMFISESPSGVSALHSKTGETLWHFDRPLPGNLTLCCGASNRGVAVLGSTVFVTTVDSYLLALDSATGKQLWQVKVADSSENYSMTGAPLALKDSVVVGVAGGDSGANGFLAAYASEDGALLWRFDTVPKRGDPGHESWSGKSSAAGGAAPWTTGSYDSSLDLIYWGTGNPNPPLDKKARKGDNLYSNCILALDAKNGELRWYFQFTPADDHDWDAVEQPVLVDDPHDPTHDRFLVTANRNGFFYVLNRENGKFILGKPFVPQNWAHGLSSDGRPRIREEASPSKKGSLVKPGHGATNWWPPSFDHTRRLLFVPVIEAGMVFYQNTALGKGATSIPPAGGKVTASVEAINWSTGNVRWKSILAEGAYKSTPSTMGGLLSTQGGLVFVGYQHKFFALDSDSGAKLLKIPLNDIIRSAPITYAINGHQYVTISAGNTVFTFSAPE